MMASVRSETRCSVIKRTSMEIVISLCYKGRKVISSVPQGQAIPALDV
jgi:hypothetical protein